MKNRDSEATLGGRAGRGGDPQGPASRGFFLLSGVGCFFSISAVKDVRMIEV